MIVEKKNRNWNGGFFFLFDVLGKESVILSGKSRANVVATYSIPHLIHGMSKIKYFFK